MRFAFIIFGLVSALVASSQSGPKPFEIKKTVHAVHSAVASAHALASEAGVAIMKKGGNAFDAAITTQLVLAVVYPGAGNLGGGGFLVAHRANGRNFTVDFRETAPLHAARDMYLDSSGNPVASLTAEGGLASGVPGSVAGMFAVLPFAKLPFADLIAPAIDLAENGFILTAAQAADLNGGREKFLRVNHGPVSLAPAAPWKAGDIVIQKELAATLRLIRDRGMKGFYEGPTADKIVAAMKNSNGIITKQDLKKYSAKMRSVLTFPYRGYSVVTMPLPSSGGIILEQVLKMTAFGHAQDYPFESPQSVHVIVEAERRAFADRAAFLGDADFVHVPVKTLLSDAYLQQRMSDVSPNKAGNSVQTGAGNVHESDQTTHISIIDKDGNAVSITTTLNDHFGNKLMVSGAGFLLNNEMDDFSVKPGSPNMYGAVGNEKNAIAPRKRMLSSMTPTIVLKGNRPFMVVGSPGGTTIPTSVVQTIMDIIDYRMTPEAAIAAPKFHHQWLPDHIMIEPKFPAAGKSALQQMGYEFETRSSIGRTELIVADDQGSVTAVADSRGEDDAEGF